MSNEPCSEIPEFVCRTIQREDRSPIVAWRCFRNISLGELVHISGYSIIDILNIHKQRTCPDDEILTRFSKIFNISNDLLRESYKLWRKK